MSKHEFWTDEAQAWLIAKDLSIPEIFSAMKYEGHSCLWHLILHPFAKLGFPIITLGIISILFVSIYVFIILFKTKLNIVTKILIVFSPGIFYKLGIISRCYSLIPFLLGLFYLIYNKRHERPYLYTLILCLLAHTHIIMCGFVGTAAIIFLIECFKQKNKDKFKKNIIIILLFTIFLILLLLQIIPSLYNCSIVSNKVINDISYLDQIYSYINFYNFKNPLISRVIVIIYLIISIVFTFINDRKKGIIYTVFLIIFLVIHLFWIIILLERIAIVFLVFFTLNYDNKNKFVILLITIISIINIYSMNYWIYNDIKYSASDSYNASKKIDYIPNDSIILIINSSRHPSLMAYLENDIDYYNLNTKRHERYITWNKVGGRTVSIEEIEKIIRKYEKKYNNIYLIKSIAWNFYSRNIDSGDIAFTMLLNEGKIKHIYTTSNNIKESGIEVYYIYKYINKKRIS